MKEFIQKNGDEVAIVIYDAPLPPKYFRLTKRFIRTLFVVVPILFVSLLFILFVWGLGTRLENAPTPSLPVVINQTDSKVNALEVEIKTLQESNKEMAARLASAPATAGSEDPYLLLIKKPYGMQNLLSQNKVTLDQFDFSVTPEKASLKFQIISSSPEQRVTGHVLVFMISKAGIMAYPKVANDQFTEGVKYSSGEPFAVSRLRPTNAEFDNYLAGEDVKFMIYIFSREGDLLLIKETSPFKVGKK